MRRSTPLLEMVPKPTAADDLAAARATLPVLAKQGVTTFLDAMGTPEAMTAYSALSREGALSVRAHFAPVILPARWPRSGQGHRDRQGHSPCASIKVRKRRSPASPCATPNCSLDGVITSLRRSPAICSRPTGSTTATIRIRSGGRAPIADRMSISRRRC